jgi:hypothetical protein
MSSENDLAGKRVPGCRVKHRAKFNWIKMYDKGSVLRVETVINQPEEFRVRRRMRRNGKWTHVWAYTPTASSPRSLARAAGAFPSAAAG